MNTTFVRGTGILALAASLCLGVSACGSSNSGDKSSSSGSSMSSTPSSKAASNAGAQTFGPGCSAIPASGAGSFNGMATAPVATAASANPLLKTLVAAVGKAGLGDTLNSAKGITVFAPTDDAFAKIPKKTLNGVLADKAELTKILTYHVVSGQLAPSALAGKHKTLEGGTVTVKGSGDAFTVNGAHVLCGNIPTANATVYVIDSVLMP